MDENRNTVLFVDDEEDILTSIQRGMIDEEYKCLFANRGKYALDLFEKNEISVIVTDMRMPEMDGLTLLRKVKEISPNTIRIVLSGYTQLQQVLVTINQGDIFKFITKPWKLEDEFKGIIREAVDYYNLKKDRDNMMEMLEKKYTTYQKILNSSNEIVNHSKDKMIYCKETYKEIEEVLFRHIKDQKEIEVAKNLVYIYHIVVNELDEFISLDKDSMKFKELEEYIKNKWNEKNHLCEFKLQSSIGNYDMEKGYLAKLVLTIFLNQVDIIEKTIENGDLGLYSKGSKINRDKELQMIFKGNIKQGMNTFELEIILDFMKALIGNKGYLQYNLSDEIVLVNMAL